MSDLAHLSTTCKALRDPAQSQLMRHIDIALQGRANSAKLVQRLLKLTTIKRTANSVALILPSDAESQYLVDIFSVILRYFFTATKRARHVTALTLTVDGACWLPLVEEILLGCSSLRHLQISDCYGNYVTRTWLQDLLTLVPSCTSLSFQWTLRGDTYEL